MRVPAEVSWSGVVFPVGLLLIGKDLHLYGLNGSRGKDALQARIERRCDRQSPRSTRISRDIVSICEISTTTCAEKTSFFEMG